MIRYWITHFLTKVFLGKQLVRPSYILVQWLFFRLFGVIYLIAFISLFFQLSGLIGSNGILPASSFLEVLIDNLGPRAFWLFPTVAWLNVSDLFLHLVALLGAVLSLLLIFWDIILRVSRKYRNVEFFRRQSQLIC